VCITLGFVSTTTVRLDNDDEQLLDKLALSFGGRSNAIRLALRNLAEDVDRHEALGAFLLQWQIEAGPVDESEVDAMSRRYNL
jgi:Arc/MetJ-type ribon-helix-helix transcriptional regulator